MMEEDKIEQTILQKYAQSFSVHPNSKKIIKAKKRKFNELSMTNVNKELARVDIRFDPNDLLDHRLLTKLER